jgi:hypothetical protein
VVEAICRIRGDQHVETASWLTDYYRKRIPPTGKVVNHSLRRQLFDGWSARPTTGRKHVRGFVGVRGADPFGTVARVSDPPKPAGGPRTSLSFGVDARAALLGEPETTRASDFLCKRLGLM